MAQQGNGVRDLVNQAAAVQMATLGASVKLWGTWLDAMATYGWRVSQSVAKVMIDDGASADAEIKALVTGAKTTLAELRALPRKVADEFVADVTKRVSTTTKRP